MGFGPKLHDGDDTLMNSTSQRTAHWAYIGPRADVSRGQFSEFVTRLGVVVVP
eukprot:m.165956 g.165956  ORF g.165956 m.165956 type:complete len:53 (-) comp24024_c1_seq1:5357-5515(-)